MTDNSYKIYSKEKGFDSYYLKSLLKHSEKQIMCKTAIMNAKI